MGAVAGGWNLSAVEVRHHAQVTWPVDETRQSVPDPLEYHGWLLQQGLGSYVVAGGCSAAAQAGERVGLVPCTPDCAGQFRGLPVTHPSLCGLTTAGAKSLSR